MSQYASAVGVVQFDPVRRTASNQEILEFMIRAVGFQGQPLVKVTLWPEFAESFDSLEVGVGVIVDGKYTQGSGDGGKVYHNLRAKTLIVLTPEPKTETDRVVNPVSERKGTAAPF